MEALTLSLAQDGVINKLRNSLPECPFPTRYTSISAFNARYRQGWLTATASLVHTATSEHAEKGTVPDDFHRFAPSLSVSMQPWQDESLYFRLMYKSTFRLPTFNDLYYYRLGNRNLRPEKADEYNVGITWSKSGLSVFDYISVTLDGYYNDVTDKICGFSHHLCVEDGELRQGACRRCGCHFGGNRSIDGENKTDYVGRIYMAKGH